MARSMAFRQINQYMYMGDESGINGISKLRPDLLREVVFDPGLRPKISLEICREFEKNVSVWLWDMLRTLSTN